MTGKKKRDKNEKNEERKKKKTYNTTTSGSDVALVTSVVSRWCAKTLESTIFFAALKLRISRSSFFLLPPIILECCTEISSSPCAAFFPVVFPDMLAVNKVGQRDR